MKDTIKQANINNEIIDNHLKKIQIDLLQKDVVQEENYKPEYKWINAEDFNSEKQHEYNSPVNKEYMLSMQEKNR